MAYLHPTYMNVLPLSSLDPPPDRGADGLLVAVRAGQPDALASVYRAHASAMLMLAYRLTVSRADAEDVVHDVFVALPEALTRYEERGQFRAWLMRVTARMALMRQRRAGNESHAMPDEVTAPPTAERDPVAAQRIHRALRQLSPSLRHVFVLRVLYDHPHADIAAMLGITVNASEVRLHRAVQQLRILLEDLA
jgi:RNA polymerase sigma-70 factor (ECF subfamily)